MVVLECSVVKKPSDFRSSSLASIVISLNHLRRSHISICVSRKVQLHLKLQVQWYSSRQSRLRRSFTERFLSTGTRNPRSMSISNLVCQNKRLSKRRPIARDARRRFSTSFADNMAAICSFNSSGNHLKQSVMLTARGAGGSAYHGLGFGATINCSSVGVTVQGLLGTVPAFTCQWLERKSAGALNVLVLACIARPRTTGPNPALPDESD
jgi:hypothetical protein